MFDETGNRQVPSSLSEVPFGKVFHAVFSLDYLYNCSWHAGESQMLFASLVRLIQV